MPHRNLCHYSKNEERANRITHGMGALLSVSALVLMLVYSAKYGSGWHLAASLVFGISLILLYTCSTLYHTFSSPHLRHMFRKLDHMSIYLLIAGTYTPFAIITLRGTSGWLLFGFIWGLTALGIVFKIFFTGRFQHTSTVIYLMMGWACLALIKPLITNLGTSGFALLAAGGLMYSVGVIFYVWEKLPFNHSIWHLFVLSGSAFHFFSIFLYIIPPTVVF